MVNGNNKCKAASGVRRERTVDTSESSRQDLVMDVVMGAVCGIRTSHVRSVSYRSRELFLTKSAHASMSIIIKEKKRTVGVEAIFFVIVP